VNAIDRTQLTVFAGGRQGRRWVGRDKGLILAKGQPIAKHLVDMVQAFGLWK